MADFAAMIGQSAFNSTQPQPLDIAGSLKRGAELALQKEELEYKRAQLSQQKQAAQTAAHEKFMNALQKVPNFKGSARSNYIKNLKAYRDALGLTETFSDDSLTFVTASDENLARVQAIKARVLDPDDPLTLGQAFELLNDPIAFADVPMEYREAAYEELYDAAKANLSFQGQRESRLATQQRFEMGQQAAADREFRSIANRLGSEIRTKFTQVEEGKIGLRNARLALDQIKADLAEGRKASSIQFNVAARGLAKAFNSGAMSDHDVADFKNLTGFSNIARDFLNKWITGDVNPEAVASLERILNNSAKNLDGKIKSLGSSFRNQFSVLPGREDELRSITGIDSLTTPTFGKGWKNNAFDESINVDERGRPLPRKQESAPQAAAPAQQQKPKLDQLPPKLIESYYRYALDPVTGVFNPARIEGLARTFGVSVDEVKRILTSRGRDQGGQ